jgi:hypothetical protein
MKLADLRTYGNQAVIDVLGKGKKFRFLFLKSETILAIQDDPKASRTEPIPITYSIPSGSTAHRNRPA